MSSDGVMVLQLQLSDLRKALETERAAREQAEECASELRGQYAEKSEALILADRERDAALARVTALEYWKSCHEGDAERSLAAETALASARELLENINQGTDWYRRRDTWLTSHPSPAPVAEKYCGRADRHGVACGQSVQCSRHAPVAETERLCQNCHLAASYGIDNGKCPEHASPPVAAPCAGCAELRKGVVNWEKKARIARKASIAAVEELEKGYQADAGAALSVLRAALKGGGA